MKAISKRAVIVIQQETLSKTGDAHLESPATMQTTDSSYYGSEANIYIKKEPVDEESPTDSPLIDTQDNTPTESNILLSREQSASYSDVDGGNANDGEPPFPGNDMQLVLKQEQDEEYSDESANEGESIVKQEGEKTSEQDYADQTKRVIKQEVEEHDDIEDSSNEEELMVKKEKQWLDDEDNTKSIAHQENDDEEVENDTESVVKQEERIADDDDEDAISQEFMVKHEEEEVGKGEIVLHQESPEQTPAIDDQDDIYQCHRCHHRTADFVSLMNHRQSVHNGKKYQGTSIKHLHLNPIIDDPGHYCRSCERKFPTRNQYRNHLQIVHHILNTKGNTTSSTHQTTSNEARESSNAIFGESSIHATASESNQHDKSSTTSYRRGRQFRCRFCKEIYSSMLILTRHQISVHNKRTKGRRTRCEDCNMNFKSYVEHEQHRLLVHSANTNETSAAADNAMPDIGTAAPTADTPAAPTTSLRATAPQSGDRLDLRITCKTCGMVFGSIKDHLNHFNSVHRVYATKRSMLDPEQSEQPTPKRQTRRKDKVKTVRFILPDTHPVSKGKGHQHSGTMKYRCRRCDIEYDTRPDLTRHRWSVHRDLSRTPPKVNANQPSTTAQFRCRSCLAECESRPALVQHLSAVHKNFNYSSPRKKGILLSTTTSFRCQSCHVECDTRSTLVIHLWAAHPENMRKAKKQPAASSEQTAQELQVADVDQTHDISTNAPNLLDANNHCRVCEKTYKNMPSYRTHMYSIHNISIAKRAYKRFRKNAATPLDTPFSATNSLPDIHDPNFYCRVCKKNLRGKYSFNSHLRAIHSIDSNQILQFAKRRNVVLDVDDPDNYCAFCDRKFKRQSTFHQHLRSHHHIKRKLDTTPLASNASSHHDPLPPSENQQYVCSVCNQRQATLGHHRQHLRITHQMVLPPISHESPKFRYPDEFIDVDSPDLYCAQCDHYFSAKDFFRKHVEGVHKLPLV